MKQHPREGGFRLNDFGNERKGQGGDKTAVNNLTGVINRKTLRKESLPYILIWIVYYAWVLAFTTWWTAAPDSASAFSVDLRSIIHIANLLSSAVCVIVFKKQWFAATARIGGAAVTIALALYVFAPDPMVKGVAAVALGAAMGCVNISMLIPLVFVLNNTEKLFAIVMSHLLSNILSLLLGGKFFNSNTDTALALMILLLSMLPVIFFNKKHLGEPPEFIIEKGGKVRPAMALTVIVGGLGAILFLGAGKALLNIDLASMSSLSFSWYYLGGIAGCLLTFLVFALMGNSVQITLSIPFGCLAVGLLCNAFAARAPAMDIVFAATLGIGTAMGMSITYYIVSVVSKKYDSMLYLRMAIPIIGLCGGIPGVLLGRSIDNVNAAFSSIVASVISIFAVVAALIFAPAIGRILFDESWANDSRYSEINLYRELVAKAEKTSAFDGINLSPRERDVAARLLQGRTLRQISADLKISESTVRGYSGTLYKKLGINSRTELVIYFGIQNDQRERLDIPALEKRE